MTLWGRESGKQERNKDILLPGWNEEAKKKGIWLNKRGRTRGKSACGSSGMTRGRKGKECNQISASEFQA